MSCIKCGSEDSSTSYIPRGAMITPDSFKKVETEFLTSREFTYTFTVTAKVDHLLIDCNKCGYQYRKSVCWIFEAVENATYRNTVLVECRNNDDVEKSMHRFMDAMADNFIEATPNMTNKSVDIRNRGRLVFRPLNDPHFEAKLRGLVISKRVVAS